MKQDLINSSDLLYILKGKKTVLTLSKKDLKGLTKIKLQNLIYDKLQSEDTFNFLAIAGDKESRGRIKSLPSTMNPSTIESTEKEITEVEIKKMINDAFANFQFRNNNKTESIDSKSIDLIERIYKAQISFLDNENERLRDDIERLQQELESKESNSSSILNSPLGQRIVEKMMKEKKEDEKQ